MHIKSKAALAAATVITASALLAGCGGTSTPNQPGPAQTQQEAPKATPTPQGTVAQLQALAAAKSYLSMGSGFSEAGLLEQLTSSAGNGFNQTDAQWAIDHSGADWNEQAVMAAKGYLKMGGFSHDSLMQQLTSDAGNKFTQAQAAYALQQVGL